MCADPRDPILNTFFWPVGLAVLAAALGVVLKADPF
jgi:hypothetical protein